MPFAARKMDPASRDEQNRRLDRLAREARLLDPGRAAQLAAVLLESLLEHGVNYADFRAAQDAERRITKARNAMRGLV